MEIWVPITGYEGAYEVSDLGRVRSLPGDRRRGIVLKPFPIRPSGHLQVALCLDGVERKHCVHHLVAAAFIGPRPDGLMVCHGPSGVTDNRAVNLRYNTRSENTYDTVADGTHPQAAKIHCAQGHAFTEANTYNRPRGGRDCRKCLADRQRTYLRRKRDRLREAQQT